MRVKVPVSDIENAVHALTLLVETHEWAKSLSRFRAISGGAILPLPWPDRPTI
jgi:hypothetical protein